MSTSLYQQKAHFLNILILGDGVYVCFHSMLWCFACRFILVHPHFITCDNPLQESLSFMISQQKLHAYFLACPFVHICKLLWHPPCTTFVIPKVLVDDGIYRSTADIQLVRYISESNPSSWTRTLTWSILYALHEVVDLPKWSSLMMLVLPIWNLSSHWYTFLHIVLIFFCESWRHLPCDHKNQMTAHCLTVVHLKAELTCVHYDCTSFVECNNYPTTCLDIAHCVVCRCMMSARSQSDKWPGFYA